MPARIIFIFCFFLLLFNLSSAQQPTLMLPIGHTERVVSAKFSPDSKMALTISTDGTAKLWEAESGRLLKDFKAGGDASIVLVTDAEFTPDMKRIIISHENSFTNVFDIRSGKQYYYLTIPGITYTTTIDGAVFSPDGNRILIPDDDENLLVCDFATLKPVLVLKGHKKSISLYQYSHDGKKIFTEYIDSTIRIWNAITGKPLTGLLRLSAQPVSTILSADDKKLFLELEDNSLQTMDLLTGKLLTVKKRSDRQETDVPNLPTPGFSPDGKLWIKLWGLQNYYNDTVQLQYWDSVSVSSAETGRLLYTMNNLVVPVSSDLFSEDSKRILLRKNDGSLHMINAATGKELFVIGGDKDSIGSAWFNTDTKMIITSSGTKPVKIWDGETGKLIRSFGEPPSRVFDARFSPDGKKFITSSEDKIARILNAVTGKELVELKARTTTLVKAKYDSTGKKILIATPDKSLVWDMENGRLSVIPELMGNDSVSLNWHTQFTGGTSYTRDSSLRATWFIDILNIEDTRTEENYSFWSTEKEIHYDAQFSPNGKNILVTSANNTVKLYDIESARPLFTFVTLDSINYLVADSSNRYDGTEAARKLLYFTCGNEVVGLDQVKDQLWVPNLAERINRGELINAKTLDELGICGLTPVVEQAKGLANEYYFKITPRSGGLGETVVSFNGNPTLSIQPSQLKKVGTGYELRLKKEDLKNYFVEGQENSIAVKSYIAGNTVSSRSVAITEGSDTEKRPVPNLYAVMVGVSDYKGDVLDLDYAAIDANDISSTLATAAKKLLGDDHVFMYNLTTEKDRYLLPEKKSIKSVFDSIGKKATANDILFIFLSGHGLIGEKNKQYYYLTSEASSAADETSLANVGISTTELTEWIKPQNIKAQKRILIMDACYSGQAINGFIKIGDPKQGFLAARGDDKSQQLKAIDKLNEKSGLFILSASSSDQKAWESGIYSHGYLTYSLLKAIKLQPDILSEGKYLDVGRWLDAAGESVSEMAKGDGSKQQPQIISSTNFNIGVVDEEVMSKISLSETKALFTSGNFLNSNETIADDDLDLRKLMDKELEALSRAEAGKKIFFIPSTNSPDAYSLTGSYTVKEDSVLIKVKLKQNKLVKFQFDQAGTKDKLKELIDATIAKTLEWVAANK